MNTQMPIGVVHDMPLSDYLAVDALSASGLKRLARSPWHYRNGASVEQTRVMLRGTLAHCAVLEPDALSQRFVVLPEDAPRRPTRAQWDAKKPSEASATAMHWWTEFQASAEGREIVSHEEFAVCAMQLEAIARVPHLRQLLRKGRGEVSIFWIDPETRIYCKARPDWVHVSGQMLDLKTCADESPGGFGRAAARMRYDLQDAHYSSGMAAVTGASDTGPFVFGAVTNRPPVLAVPYVLTDDIREQGQEDRRELMARLAWCRSENQWPAYGDGIQLLDFPAYAKRAGAVDVEWAEDEGVTA